MLLSDEHCANDHVLSAVTVNGMHTDERDVQSENALVPTALTAVPIIRD